jgi:hypothetical protein
MAGGQKTRRAEGKNSEALGEVVYYIMVNFGINS